MCIEDECDAEFFACVAGDAAPIASCNDYADVLGDKTIAGKCDGVASSRFFLA